MGPYPEVLRTYFWLFSQESSHGMLGMSRVSVCQAIISTCGTSSLAQEPQSLVNNEGKEGESRYSINSVSEQVSPPPPPGN